MHRSTTDFVPFRRWEGGPGLQSLNPDGRFTVPDPSRFQSTWRQVEVDGVRVGEWATSPIAGVLPVSRDGRSIALIVVDYGAVRLWASDQVIEMRAGALWLCTGGRLNRFTITQPSRVLRIVTPASLLSSSIHAATDLSPGLIESTRLTAGLTAIVEQVLDEMSGGATCPAARALRPLAIAAVEDALPEEDDDDDLRTRILAFIEQNLNDPDLGPKTIADEFGISLRWTHHVFNVEGPSVARHIKERRVDVVAERLRDDLHVPRIGALAERVGFSHRDQLTRAFKARYGVTITEYWELATRHTAPAPTS